MTTTANVAAAKASEALAGSATKEFKKESATARILGAGSYAARSRKDPVNKALGCAGIAELMIFHPVTGNV